MSGQDTFEDYFPQYLSYPLRYAWFDEEEAYIFIFSMWSLMMWSPTVSIVCWGWIGFVKFMKKQFPRGFMFHFLYVVGISNFDGYPPSHITVLSE